MTHIFSLLYSTKPVDISCIIQPLVIFFCDNSHVIVKYDDVFSSSSFLLSPLDVKSEIHVCFATDLFMAVWVLYGTVNQLFAISCYTIRLRNVDCCTHGNKVKQITYGKATAKNPTCFFLFFSCRHQSRQLLQNQPFSRRQWLRHGQLWVPAPWVLTFILPVKFAVTADPVQPYGETEELSFLISNHLQKQCFTLITFYI